ncbi:MAG: ABC transporter ATP-binding protein, partial [Armatimonadota bacterium]
MIEITNASRWYGEILGVNDVTCTVGPGITALLGMNGAGKSTLLRMITGQLRPTTGSVKVFGEEPFGNPNVFKHLGYCPEIDNFYEYMSGREFVRYMARLSGMSAGEAKSKTDQMIEMVGMSGRADKKIKGYSKGMRQRIKLAQAMVHNPDIILLDEPLNGLDPVGRHEFLGVLAHLAEIGKTILVSSHILYEVEQMTHSLLLLHRGRLLATGDLGVIRELIDKYPHKVRIETPQPREVAARLTSMANIVSTRIDEKNDEIELEVRDPNSFYASLSTLVLEQKMPILSFN